MAVIGVSLQLDDEYAERMKVTLDRFETEMAKIQAETIQELMEKNNVLSENYVPDEKEILKDVLSTSEEATEQINNSFKSSVKEATQFTLPLYNYRDVTPYIEWVTQNIEMNNQIPRAYSESVNKEIQKLVTKFNNELKSSLDVNQIRQQINNNINYFQKEAMKNGRIVTENTLDFWARDQVGNFTAEQTKGMFKEYGLRTYIWRTRGDLRVREEHAVLDNMIIVIDESPIGVDPGEDWACRCSYDVNGMEARTIFI